MTFYKKPEMTWPPPPELTFRTKEQVQDWVTKQPGGPQFWSGLRVRILF